MRKPSEASQRIIPFIIALTFFMEALDSTVINAAMPAMSRSLLVDPIDLKIALISYLLSLAIFIPICGWVADKYGSKRVFMTALSIFALSSIWCGFSQHLTELVIARFIQGFGGALGLPVGRLIIVRTFARQQLINIMSRVVMIGSLGLMLGPVIGGYITHYFSWHWIFWINIPVGIFTLILTGIWLPTFKPESVAPLDKFGFLTFGSGLACLMFGLSALSESRISHYIGLIVILFSLGLLILYFFHSRGRSNPIVKTELFRLRTFRISVLGNLISRLGFGGTPFLLTLLLQVGLRFSPQRAGLLVAPMALGVLLSKPFAFPLLQRFGFRQMLISNTIVAALSTICFATINAHTPLYLVGNFTFMYGIIIALQYSAMNSLAYSEINAADFSAANSIMSTLQQLSLSFGVAITAISIRIFSGFFTTANMFRYSFMLIALITFSSTFIFLRLNADDGNEMIA